MSTPRAKTSGMSTSGRPSQVHVVLLVLDELDDRMAPAHARVQLLEHRAGPETARARGRGRASRPRAPRAAAASRRRAPPPSRRAARRRGGRPSRAGARRRRPTAAAGRRPSRGDVRAHDVGLGGADRLDLVVERRAADRLGIGAAKSGTYWRSGDARGRSGPRSTPRRALRVPARPTARTRRGGRSSCSAEQARDELPQRAQRQPRAREVVVGELDADHERGP